MADKVKLSKDGSSIDFVQSENIPTSVKKFRQSPEIEGFYRFVFENDLQKEAFEILSQISVARKAKKLKEKQDAQPAKKAEDKKVKETKKTEPIPTAKLSKAKLPATKVTLVKKVEVKKGTSKKK